MEAGTGEVIVPFSVLTFPLHVEKHHPACSASPVLWWIRSGNHTNRVEEPNNTDKGWKTMENMRD